MSDHSHHIRCFIPDDIYVWLPVEIQGKDISNLREKETSLSVNTIEVDAAIPNAVIEKRHLAHGVLDLDHIHYQNEDRNVDDMIRLEHLHEAAVLYNLQYRFCRQQPYTYISKICIALNPYRQLPELYDVRIQEKYSTVDSLLNLPPHIYGISNAAYSHMMQFTKHQSILVSGESGAGKTESNKIIMTHLASLAGGLDDCTIRKIIQINPLLESFGNASTILNDNSSRVGRFTQLQFDAKGTLVGSDCRTYLLEKSRVIHQDKNERNFHIFYQLMTSPYVDKLGLGESKSLEFRYLNDKKPTDADRSCFARTVEALHSIGVDTIKQEQVFELIFGILLLGQLDISYHSNETEERSKIITSSDTSENGWNCLNSCACLLGLSKSAIEEALCTRTMTVANETVTVQLRKQQASDCRDALAKAIYANLFTWLIDKINSTLRRKEHNTGNVIGILDIFGFENLEYNSFEQFCINFANEKLQQKFSQDIFKTVQLEYINEGIRWEHVDFVDNQEVIALIEERLGIISLLNDEIMRPKGNEESFVLKLKSIYEDEQHLIEFPKCSRTLFTIKHYAGAVTYEAVGFLEKHRDALLPDLSDLMRSSSKELLRNVFGLGVLFHDGNNRYNKARNAPSLLARKTSISQELYGTRSIGTIKTLSTRNAGTQFKDNLNELMTTLRDTNIHYVRCVKPNRFGKSDEFDHLMVTAQLRCAGVVEAIRIARAVYQNWLRLEEFQERFRIFLRNNNDSLIKKPHLSEVTALKSGDKCDTDKTRYNCQEILDSLHFNSPEDYQMGFTRIYLNSGILESLERRRTERFEFFVRQIQHTMRGFLCHLNYTRQRQAILKIQSIARCVIMRNRYQDFICAVINVQAHWRGVRDRRSVLINRELQHAVRIQARYRGYLQRQQSKRERAAAIRIQSFVHMKIQRSRHRNELAEKRLQHNMALQLSRVQLKLYQESNRNESEYIRFSGQNSKSGLPSRTVQHGDVAFSPHTSEHQIQNKWMEDVGSVINQLRVEVERLRKESEQAKELNHSLRSEIEKLRNEKEITTASFRLKISQDESQIRKKDQQLATIKRENTILRDRVCSYSTNSEKRKNEKGSLLPTLGLKSFHVAKKQCEQSEDEYFRRKAVSSADPASLQASLTEKRAATDDFLRESAEKISGMSDTVLLAENSDSLITKGRSNKHFAERQVDISSLQNRLSAIKGRYNAFADEDASLTRSELVPKQNDISSSGLDARISSSKQSSLPPGWEARLSRSKNKIYYCNPTLHLTQWDRPEAILAGKSTMLDIEPGN
uniref:Myosinlike protein putative n=1 Tax=Albugo laibachii Nc14 TaxID=890382 RepID=F0VZ84_9STRA|nr:myosinlike protein putative [Albugo laibachii Nc14]|eukprot:CCA14100.1 myosinlike protein putative [Albugo laibachii Nc14]